MIYTVACVICGASNVVGDTTSRRETRCGNCGNLLFDDPIAEWYRKNYERDPSFDFGD